MRKIKKKKICESIVKKIVQIYLYRIKRDPISLARWLGVRIGEGGQILDNPVTVFGTEPWLISLGNHVDVTAGVRFLTHEGGIWVARGLKPELNMYDWYEEFDYAWCYNWE